MAEKYTLDTDEIFGTVVKNETAENIAIKHYDTWNIVHDGRVIGAISDRDKETAQEVGEYYEVVLAKQNPPIKTVTINQHNIHASDSFVGEGVELMQIWLRTKLAYAAIELVQMSLDDRPRDEIYRAENDLAREIIEVVRHGKVEVEE